MKQSFTILFIFIYYGAHCQTCDPNTHSLFFNGTNAYVAMNSDNDLNITDDITVEAWINASSWGATYVSNSIVCKHGWSAGEKGYVLRCGGNGQLSFAIAGVNNGGVNVSWQEIVSPVNALQLHTWHHVAGKYDGHKIRLYIDGIQVGSKNFTGSIDPSVDYHLKIGRIADDNTNDKRYFHGTIDEVRIWNKAVNTTDIDNNKDHHIDPATVTNLVGYWRLNDGGTSNTVHDYGSGENEGTLLNATWNTDVPFTNGIARPVITFSNNVLTSSSSVGNQWNLDGSPINGATSDQFVPSQNGEYTVTVDSGNGCSATSLVFVILNTGIGESLLPNQISYHLTNNILYLNVPESSGQIPILISDMDGRRIFQDEKIPEEINLQLFAKGIYFLTFQFSSSVVCKRIQIN
jgi:hypothetical protein